MNQEGARIVADLSHAEAALYDQQMQGRQFAQEIAVLQEAVREASAQFAGKEAQATWRQEQVAAIMAKADTSSAQVRGLELALAATQATSTAQPTGKAGTGGTVRIGKGPRSLTHG